MRKFDIVTIISILTIITGFAFWLGEIQGKIKIIDVKKIDRKINDGIQIIDKKIESLDPFPVGTIVASIVKPDVFGSMYGNNWKLLNGENIIGTRLSKLIKKEKLPDAGGKFLRCINTKNDTSTQDPSGIREPGSFQKDAIKKHSHNTQGYDKAAWYGDNLVHAASNTNGGLRNNKTLAYGEAETRPKNIAVYLYI